MRLKLYKGNTTVVGRKSPKSLYSMKTVTFEDDAGAYDQRDAEGFIKLNALRLGCARRGRVARRSSHCRERATPVARLQCIAHQTRHWSAALPA